MKIKGFDDYEIYPETGQVFSYKTGKFLKPINRGRGYLYVFLTNNEGKSVPYYLHRLIYTAAYGEIPKGMQINHIDENKQNNCISNLNLMTCKENVNWGTRNERAGKALSKILSKPLVILKNGKTISYFESTVEAERNGFNKGHLSEVCNGKRKTTKGCYAYYWDDYLRYY